MKSTDFRIVLQNLSPADPRPAEGKYSHIIKYFLGDIVKFVGITDESRLTLEDDETKAVRFKSVESATKKLEEALEAGDLESYVQQR